MPGGRGCAFEDLLLGVSPLGSKEFPRSVSWTWTRCLRCRRGNGCLIADVRIALGRSHSSRLAIVDLAHWDAIPHSTRSDAEADIAIKELILGQIS
jgi:hypothetical protein